MHGRLLLLRLFLVSMFVAAPAFADAPQDDVYVPTSAWLVGPAFLTQPAGMEKMQTPCVMANQYNNGYVFRYSGGGKKIMAMAIDFRQQVFKPGKSYDIGVAIGADYSVDTKGSAYDEATLIVNLQDDKDFYTELGKGRILAIDIQGKRMEFALLGLRDGMSRMEACYKPGAAPQGGGERQAAQSQEQEEPMPMHSASFADAMPSAGGDGKPAQPQQQQQQGGAANEAMPERARLMQELQGTQVGAPPAETAGGTKTNSDDRSDALPQQQSSVLSSMLQTAAERLNLTEPAAGNEQADHLPTAGGNNRAAANVPGSNEKPAGMMMARNWMPPAPQQPAISPSIQQAQQAAQQMVQQTVQQQQQPPQARIAPYLVPPAPQPARQQQILMPVNPYPENPATAVYQAANYPAGAGIQAAAAPTRIPAPMAALAASQAAAQEAVQPRPSYSRSLQREQEAQQGAVWPAWMAFGKKPSSPQYATPGAGNNHEAPDTQGGGRFAAMPFASFASARNPQPQQASVYNNTVPAERHWRAMKGNNLREILDTWTQSENMRLIWKSPDDFAVTDSVVVKGGVDDAVGEVLAQYQNARARPVGHVYRDPATGQKVLVVDEEKAD